MSTYRTAARGTRSGMRGAHRAPRRLSLPAEAYVAAAAIGGLIVAVMSR